MTYTFLIQNLGNTAADAATGVVITDTFNPVLENLTVNFNGTAWAEGTNYTYDTTTGLFTGTAGGITVPAATYTQDPVTGAWGINPGVSTLMISGTV
ncbi:repeat domain protein [human gut metagenome]|uniref:Repeat domain protein n=1 Tax=human gut metagenome TaxID=408170 RepID=K1TPD3_9ZZZZ